MQKRVIYRVASLQFSVLIDRIIYFLYLFLGNRVVGKHVRSVEIDLGQHALVVGQSSSAKSNLLDFLVNHHVQDSFRTCLDIVS